MKNSFATNGKVKRLSLFLFSFSFFLFIITACTSPTSSSKGSLTGTVSLEGETDFSGISVSLYELAYLDTTIVRINNEYPQIGVIITQHTEFDHRLQSPLKTATTLADGSFEIEKIPTGIYNLVAQKADFGFRYLYEVSISKGDNELSEKGNVKREAKKTVILSDPALTDRIEGRQTTEESNSSSFILHSSLTPARLSEESPQRPATKSDITLYEEVRLSENDYFGDLTIEPYHHLVIENDVSFAPPSSLTLMPDGIVRINPGCDLKIYGNLTAQGEEGHMFWVTSNDGFITEGKRETGEEFSPLTSHVSLNRDSDISLYNSMELTPISTITDNLIEWGKWDWGNITINNKVFYLQVKNQLFRHFNSGLFSSEVDSIRCANVIMMDGNNDSMGALHFLNYSNGCSLNNIFVDCSIAIKAKEYCSPLISNNLVKNCEMGLELLRSESIVINNDISRCIKAIRVAGITVPVIENNNLYDCDIGFEMGGYGGYYPDSNAEIHLNNINMQSYYYYLELFTLDLNPSKNFYFSTELDEINGKIYDKKRYSQDMQDIVGSVNCEPYLWEYNDKAGIK